jgi:hypothetical protein
MMHDKAFAAGMLWVLLLFAIGMIGTMRVNAAGDRSLLKVFLVLMWASCAALFFGMAWALGRIVLGAT